MEYQYLKIENKDRIKIATLTNPVKSNALSISMMQEICSFADSLNEDEQTRVVVFTGAGKNFCTGLDLSDEDRARQFQTDSKLMKIRQHFLKKRRKKRQKVWRRILI